MDDFDNSPENEFENEMPQHNMIQFEDYAECTGDPSDIMKKHLLCNLCGGHLSFNHLSDYQHGLIQETARCPDCGIRTRQRLHKIQ